MCSVLVFSYASCRPLALVIEVDRKRKFYFRPKTETEVDSVWA